MDDGIRRCKSVVVNLSTLVVICYVYQAFSFKCVVYEFTDSRFWYGKQSSGRNKPMMNTTLVDQI